MLEGMVFRQVMEVARLTGSPVMMVDGDSSFVVMDFAQYRAQVLSQREIAGLTERELLDTINRTIAIWKQEHGDIDMMTECDTLNQPFTDCIEDGYTYESHLGDLQE